MKTKKLKFTNSQIQNLNNSKCFSNNTLLKYHKNILTNRENNNIEKHLLYCEMCQDVVDGFSELPDKNKLPLIILDLNKQINKKTAPQGKVIKFNSFKIIAMAASFVLLLGLSILIGKNFINSNEMTMAESLNYKVNKTEIGREMPPTEDVSEEIEKESKIEEQKLKNIIPIITDDIEDKDENDMSDKLVVDYEMNENIVIDKTDSLKTKSDAYSFGDEINDDEELNITNVEKFNDVNTDEIQPNVSNREHTNNGIIAESEVESLDEVEITSLTRKNRFYNKKTEKSEAKGYTVEQEQQEGFAYNSLSENIDTGIYFYNNQQYTQAVDNFTLALEQEPNNETATFYTAQCYQESGSNIKSLMYYNQITNDKNNEFYYNAQFNKASIYIELGLTSKATKILNELSSEDNPFKEQSKTKLEEINK